MKRLIIHGLVAGLLAAIGGIIYFYLYQEALGTAFDPVINVGSIAGASIFGCILMTAGYAVLLKLNKESLIGWFNLAILVLSFLSIVGPIGMSLPLDIGSPELFPGLVVPMHFFPALAFLAAYPLFSNKAKV